MFETSKRNSWVDKNLIKRRVLKRTELYRMVKRTEPLETGWRRS